MSEKEPRKEAKRMSFLNLHKNISTLPQYNSFKVQSGNIKRTISVFEQLSCPKQLPDRQDNSRNTRTLAQAQRSSLINGDSFSSVSLEKRENIAIKALEPLNDVKLRSSPKIAKTDAIPERRRYSCVFSPSDPAEFSLDQEKMLTRKSLLDPVEKIEDMQELLLLKPNNTEGDPFSLLKIKDLSKDLHDKLLDEKFLDIESHENTFHINDSSSLLCNSLDSGSFFDGNCSKDEPISTKEKSDAEKAFNEKYLRLIQQNDELMNKNKHYEEIIDILNREIQEKSSLISETENNKYIEQINSLGHEVEKLACELNNSSTYNKKLLEQINFCKLESQLSTDILKSEIEKSKDIIKNLEEQLKGHNVDQLNFHDHLESFKLYYIEREKMLQNKIISAEQAIDAEKMKSAKNMEEIQKKLEESDSLKKNVEEELSLTLTVNNELLKEISYLKNNCEIKDNYESALKDSEGKNNASLEDSGCIKEVNNQLKITQDELQEERKKLEDKTKQCNKLFLEFSELEMKYFNLQKKIIIKNEQITKHIFKIREHELTLGSLLKEHNSLIEKLNIQQNILCKYTDMIKEKDNLIKHYKEDFEKLHFIYLEEINHIHNNFENRKILSH